MKACVIQPYYSFDYKENGRCFEEMVALLDRCDESMDITGAPDARAVIHSPRGT